MYKLFKENYNFRMFYLGGLISCIGDYLYDIAVTLLVYDITRSVNSIAFMWISKGALRVFVQHFAGVITDRYDRRKVIIFTNLLSIPGAILFLFINNETVWIAYIGTFLLQALNDIDTCSEMAILPELVNKEEIGEANTIFSFTETGVMFISLAVSGVIYRFFGSDILFSLNAISFLISAICFYKIRYKGKGKAEDDDKLVIFDKQVIEIIKKEKYILDIMLVSMLFSVICRIYDVYNILIADSILGIGSEGIIYFRYSMALGGLITPFIIKKMKKYNEFNKFIFITAGLATLFGILPVFNSIIVVIADLILISLLISIQGICFKNILQENVENRYLGRIFATYKIIITISSLITVAIIPLISDKVSVVTIFIVAGAMLLISCIYFMLKKGDLLLHD